MPTLIIDEYHQPQDDLNRFRRILPVPARKEVGRVFSKVQSAR
jgi:hypothetical protein